MINLRGGVLAGFVLSLCACGPIVPATTPPQLQYTPGPPVVITHDLYISTTFAARYPAAWHVITSPAFSDTWVVFLGEKAVIGLALDAEDIAQIAPSMKVGDDLQREQQTIMLVTADGEVSVTGLLVASEADWVRYQSIFRDVMQSIAPPSAYAQPRAEA